ncbi:LysR family transcriptional regulator [Curvibacter sp. HBC61]|uniref:LysR family transcriptional regulator n=1 Tax=Curvibacter cyanobacteriorum TaxID=3026422 RepID=A0ABT5MXV3_9BURK|nr:LysR family transcriptional regulator [Curvibacter sp. HBC61]MDD0838891.1 LysR family transcriptional regulator [Curvibacter sp. HBC61]
MNSLNPIRWSSSDLEAFAALVQTRHFTRAAERCHLSQSAFSQKIRRLETAVGARLFERSTRQVSLTPEGELLAQEVLRLEQELQQALGRLQALAGLQAGRVAVAALPSLAAVWLPELVAQWRQQHPQVQLTVHDTLAQGATNLLREGRVDFALTAGGDLREFDTELLLTEPYWLVCPARHRLAARGAAGARWDDLAGEELIHLARSSSVRQQIERLNLRPSWRTSALEVEHLATLAGLVRAGLGLTLVPALTLFHFAGPGLAVLPFLEPALSRPVVLARRKGQALSVAAQAWRELLHQRVAAERMGLPPK